MTPQEKAMKQFKIGDKVKDIFHSEKFNKWEVVEINPAILNPDIKYYMCRSLVNELHSEEFRYNQLTLIEEN